MRAVEGNLGRSLEERLKKMGRIIYSCPQLRPGGVYSPVDRLDPVHGGGDMLIHTKMP
jgi:hypothetical protein